MSDETIIYVQDSTAAIIPMKGRVYSDGSKSFYHVIDDRLPTGVDRSGTTVVGSKSLAAQNSNRVGLSFQNTSDTNMFIAEDGTTATAQDYLVPPGVKIEISTNNAINVFCGTAGKTYAATERVR